MKNRKKTEKHRERGNEKWKESARKRKENGVSI